VRLAAAPARLALEARLIAGGALLAVAGGGVLIAARARNAEMLGAAQLVGAVVAALGVLALLVGLAIYVVVPPLRGERNQAEVGSHRVILATLCLAILCSNLVPLLLFRGRPALGLRSVDGFLGAALSTAVALLALGYVRTIRAGLVSAAELGVRRDGLGRLVATGVAGGLALFALSGAVQLLLQKVGIRQTQLEGFAWIRSLSPSSFLLILVAASVVAPVAEELFFRGFVFQSYARRYGPRVAALLSSLLFAALHLNLQALVPIFVMGLFLAWLYWRTHSLLPGIVAHGFNNAVAFTVLYLVGL